VRVLHAGMVMAALSLIEEAPEADRIGRCARGSRATCAAAPATTTSSRGDGRRRLEGGQVIPAAFDYVRAGSADEAVSLLTEHGDDA